ncbi:hypothetical protein BH23ACT9_BH23ACT9_23260 [soil metagenome]
MLGLLLASLATSPAAAQPTDPDAAYDGAGLVGISEPIHEESVTEVLEIPTDYGTLYGEVIRPVVSDGVAVPVILTYSPYNVISQALTLNGSIADDAVADYFVPRGYARAVFDVIGTRNSGGCYDYGGIGERETGAALVDALGTQPWSNGRVGMIGGSYDGTTQWAAAIENPEHLTTIVPQVAIDRWYDYAYGGGIRYFLNSEDPSDEGFDTPLAFDFGFGFLPSVDPTRPSPDLQLEALQGRFNPCQRIQNTQRAYESDPVYDDFWDERDYRARADQITASVLIEGGWLDHNVKHWNSTRMFAALPEDLPRHLVMGQWAHSTSRHADALDLRHAWFDHWLLGLDTGVDTQLPLVDSQMGGTGERAPDSAWPPADTTVAELPLGGDDAGLVLVGSGEASWREPVAPQTTEAEVLASQTSPRGTYVHFLSADPLDAPVRITGSPTVTLDVVTEGTSTHFTPILYEQAADGAIEVITRGFLNAKNRDGLDVSTDVTPGQPYTAVIEMWDVDFEVAEGSRIGLALSSHLAEWVLPDDEQQGANTLGGGSSLALPVNRGHLAVGAPRPGVALPGVVDRIAGPGRIETAAAVSASAFDRAETAVLATAADYPDALTAGPLAAGLDAPLLLSDPAGLSPAAATEIRRLEDRSVLVVGGELALSAAVVEDLEVLGVTPRRVAGPDRFATAAAVAAEVVAAGAEIVPYVVEGEHADPARGWPDAVATGPLAAFEGRPILLVNAQRLPQATVDALNAIGATGVTVVGGEAAVSPQVASAIADEGFAVQRVAGASRYATSALLHARMVEAGMDGREVWLATGANWPDALAAGPAVSFLGHTLALVDGTDLDGSPETRALLGPDTTAVHLLGGTSAISDRVRDQVQALLSG